MMACFVNWFFGMLAVALPAWWVTVRDTCRSRGRWGFREKVHEAAGDGPYREGETREPIARRAPLSVWLMAILGPAWGTLTLFLLGPLHAIGAVGLPMCRREWDGRGPCEIGNDWHVAAALLEAGIALSAFVLGITLFCAAILLPKLEAGSLKLNHVTARYALVHHVFSFAWCIVTLALGEELAFLTMVNLTSIVGLGIAALHSRAVTHARAASEEPVPEPEH